MVLNHLLEIVRQRDIDTLVIAGDVFDSQHPSTVSALETRIVCTHNGGCCLPHLATSG